MVLPAPQFEELNSYSYKRRTTNIGNPAIIWHRAYWRPTNMETARWHRLINEYIADTLDRHKGKVRDMTEPPSGEDLAAFNVGFVDDDGVKTSIVFEKFDEFWSIKTIIDYSRVADGAALEDWPLKIFTGLKTCETVIVGGLIKPEELHKHDRLIKDHSHIISDALVQLVASLFPRLEASDEHRTVIDIKDLFANFIGFSLGFDRTHDVAQRLDWQKQLGVIANVAPKSRLPADLDRLGDIVQAIWPVARWLNPYLAFGERGSLIKADAPEHVEDQTREFTISRLNRGRALYVTSLGGMSTKSDAAIFFPLSYLMICPHKATWQIGRIIDRIHTLGMFRMATLRDYAEIEASDRDMRLLVNDINRPLPDIPNISRRFDTLRPNIANGLHHRIEWSKYYMSLYRETMHSLEFRRVEGYQTYPEFVSNKFMGRFKTIESVSNRYDYLSRQIRAKTNQSSEITIKELLTTAEVISIIPISYYLAHVIEIANNALLEGMQPLLPWYVPHLLWTSGTIGYMTWLFRKWRKREPHRGWFGSYAKPSPLGALSVDTAETAAIDNGKNVRMV